MENKRFIRIKAIINGKYHRIDCMIYKEYKDKPNIYISNDIQKIEACRIGKELIVIVPTQNIMYIEDREFELIAMEQLVIDRMIKVNTNRSIVELKTVLVMRGIYSDERLKEYYENKFIHNENVRIQYKNMKRLGKKVEIKMEDILKSA